MHIAVEGPDSTGKAAAARQLAQALDGLYIEKPLQYLLGGRSRYTQLAEKLNAQPSKDLRAWFYGFSNLYFSDYLAERTVVTDRYFPSNWVSNCTRDNLPAFDALAAEIRRPEHTFLLSGSGPDADTPSQTDAQLETLYRQCLDRYGFPYTVLETTRLQPAEVLTEMLFVLREQGLLSGGSTVP